MLLEEGVCYDQCVLLAKLFTCELLNPEETFFRRYPVIAWKDWWFYSWLLRVSGPGRANLGVLS